MEKTYGIGIIGWGFMGKTHTYAYRSLFSNRGCIWTENY